MTPDETRGRPQTAPSEPQTAQENVEADLSVRRPRFVVLELRHDAREVGASLDTLTDTVIREGSRLGAVLSDLAEQLGDPDTLEHQLRDALTRRLDAAWHEQLDATVRHSDGARWSLHKFRAEWDSYLDPATAQPYPLPYRWDRRVDRVEAAGLPWRIARDQIHDTLTGNGPRTLNACVRGCHRHLTRNRERVERDLAIERT